MGKGYDCKSYEELFTKIVNGETLENQENFLAQLTLHIVTCEECLKMVKKVQTSPPKEPNGSPQRGLNEYIQ